MLSSEVYPDTQQQLTCPVQNKLVLEPVWAPMQTRGCLVQLYMA